MTERVTYRAKTKFLVASPTKVRPVANVVKCKPYVRAMALLGHLPHKGARLISKVMKSAASNAIDRDKRLDEERLFVRDIQIDEGHRLKRLWCRGRGRGDVQLKRMCHITVVVEESVRTKDGSKG